MSSKNSSPKKFWYGKPEGYEMRSQRRLQYDLGVDATAADAILRLRNQVVELQAQIRQLGTELDLHYAELNSRLARYREISYEATWIELDIQE